jgi:hypothetical protein
LRLVLLSGTSPLQRLTMLKVKLKLKIDTEVA